MTVDSPADMMAGPFIPASLGPEVDIIDVALSTVRTHLGMEIAYLSEFVEGRAVFRAVSAPGLEDMIAAGDSQDLSDIYCQHILEGRLPNVIPDTKNEPVAMALPITQAVPIASHVSVPIHRRDGTVYGMFCCLSPHPNPSLNDRDLKVMKTFAGLAQSQLHINIDQRVRQTMIRSQIEDLCAGAAFDIVLQPIFAIDQSVPCAFEALCRFHGSPPRPPNAWFDEAKSVDLHIDLEMVAIEKALTVLPHLPEWIYVTVNVSPAGICSGRLRDVLMGQNPERVVIEVTEHDAVSDDVTFHKELRYLSGEGFRIAIDDVGSGYSGLSHILQTLPQKMKLDMELVRDIDRDIARQALVAGLIHFAAGIGATIVAEGVETQAELSALRELGVDFVQGYLLGRPDSLAAALAWFEQSHLAVNRVN